MVTVDAKAKANPANEAEMLGVIKDTRAVAPTTAEDSKLKRTESHLFTIEL